MAESTAREDKDQAKIIYCDPSTPPASMHSQLRGFLHINFFSVYLVTLNRHLCQVLSLKSNRRQLNQPSFLLILHRYLCVPLTSCPIVASLWTIPDFPNPETQESNVSLWGRWEGAFTFGVHVIHDGWFILTCWPIQQWLLHISEDLALIWCFKQKHFFLRY